jgi:LasA protease
MGRGQGRKINLRSMYVTWGALIVICVVLLVISPMISGNQGYFAAQGVPILPIIADGQFVWGPNVGNFNVARYLERRSSPLLAYAPDIEVWAAYTSINPKVLLTILELRNQWITEISSEWDESEILDEIEAVSMELATNFYDHMYAWGIRSDEGSKKSLTFPSFEFDDSGVIQINPESSSGSFAIASALSEVEEQNTWENLVSPKSPVSFSAVFSQLFPDTDLLDESNNLVPPGTLPDDFLQLPFPLGADWTFNGTHSWHGGDIGPDRSSMDFSTNWPRGSNLPDHYTVASHDGFGYVYAPSRTSLPCWAEIYYEMAPGQMWSTSYYHLLNLGAPGDRGWMVRNQAVGKIGVEVCNGGFASSAHVHFTLRYNGAFYDLDEVKLSGWSVHSGSDPYYSGYLERDGEYRYPYERLINDYHEYYGHGLDFALALQDSQNQTNNYVWIQIDDPDQDTPGPPADVGFHDFVVEWWMKAAPNENNTPAIECGANDNWKDGNIIFDRSRSIAGSEWGVSLVDGLIALGVRGGSNDTITLCSTTRVDDGSWHHIAIQRNRWDGSNPDGQLWIYIDGILENSAQGPGGDISYPDDDPPGTACSPSETEECIFSDPYLFIGSSKSTRGRGFTGVLEDVRFSWWLRYLSGFDPNPGLTVQDSQTVGLLQFNERNIDTLFDTGGYNGGTSNANFKLGISSPSVDWTYSDLIIQTWMFFPTIN